MWQAVLPWLRQGLDLLLLPGGVPEHVAFIMDGNRRFATKEHIGKLEGHTMGYGKMVDVIHWCLELGVRYISVYAFSIDNFQRSPDEVGALMHLAEEKYRELAAEDGLAERKGVEMRILGALDLAPPSVRGAAARLMRATAALKDKRAVLNICFSYTSTEEWAGAVGELQGAVQGGSLQPGDITAELLQRCLRTQECPPVDLMIRTSGETRLSDFLLWQVSHATLCFVPTLWPDLRFLDFAQCILQYQLGRGHQQRLRQAAGSAILSAQQQHQQGHVQQPGNVRQQQQQQQSDDVSSGSLLPTQQQQQSQQQQEGHQVHQHWEPVTPYRWASHPGLAAVRAGGRQMLAWLTGARQHSGSAAGSTKAGQQQSEGHVPTHPAAPLDGGLVGGDSAVAGTQAVGAGQQPADAVPLLQGLADQLGKVMGKGACEMCDLPCVQSAAPSSTVSTPPGSSPSSTRSSTSADGCTAGTCYMSSPTRSPVCCGLEGSLVSVLSSPGSTPAAAAAALLCQQAGIGGGSREDSSSLRHGVRHHRMSDHYRDGESHSAQAVGLEGSAQPASDAAYMSHGSTTGMAITGCGGAAADTLQDCSICVRNRRVRALLTQQQQHQLDWVTSNVRHGQD